MIGVSLVVFAIYYVGLIGGESLGGPGRYHPVLGNVGGQRHLDPGRIAAHDTNGERRRDVAWRRMSEIMEGLKARIAEGSPRRLGRIVAATHTGS